MIITTIYYNFVRVILIFIIDEIFKFSLEFPDLCNIFSLSSTLGQVDICESLRYYEPFLKIIVSCLVFCLSLCLFILPDKYLFKVPIHIISVYIIYFSCWFNMQILEDLSEQYKNVKADTVNEVIVWDVDRIINLFTQLQLYHLFRSILMQYYLLLIFENLQNITTNYSMCNIFRYSFFIPTLLASILKTRTILNIATILSTLLQLFYLLKTLWLNISIIITLIKDGYNYTLEIINNLGVFILIEREWSRIKMPSVLKIFWAAKVLIQILNPQYFIELQNETLFGVLKYLLIKGSDTYIAVLAMTCFVSYFCDYIKTFYQWVLQVNDLDDINSGITSAILFVLLAIQSGLTELDSEDRLLKLCENICLVCIDLQHQIHNMVDKLLKSLSSSHNTSLIRHSRALLVCGFLLLFAVTILIYLWSNYSVGPWLLAVSSLNIITIIKVLVSLAVYTLLLIDTYCLVVWEKLDDYVYYINSFGDIVELCIRIFFFLNGVYYVAFISGGVVRIFVICAQAYSNIRHARKKWKEFIKRSIATKKIESLSQATSTQLSEFNDVCAICRENMSSARITKCNHYFHSECLRKWFYLNDLCPLCQNVLK